LMSLRDLIILLNIDNVFKTGVQEKSKIHIMYLICFNFSL